MKKEKQKKKVLFMSSTGGHLHELLQLSPLFEKYDYYIVTEKTKSNVWLKEKHGDRVDFLLYGSRNHIFSYILKFIFNFFRSLYLYFKIRPEYIVTTGTHTAVSMCYISKIFGTKVIFIETFANNNSKTLSGKIIYPISNLFIVQWESMLKLYPNAVYAGSIY